MYIEIFFWIFAFLFFSVSIVHFSKSFKTNDATYTTKGIMYMSAAIVLAVLLTYRPFSPAKFVKILKPAERLSSSETVMIATSLASPATVSV